MSSDFHTERDAFNAFIDSRFAQTSETINLEAVLAEFRVYQQELASARAKVQEAKLSSQRGEAAELDIEQLIQEVTQELAQEGIRE